MYLCTQYCVHKSPYIEFEFYQELYFQVPVKE